MKLNCVRSSFPASRIWDFDVDKWFSIMGDCAPRGHLTMSGGICGGHTWRRGGPTGWHLVVGTGDAATRPVLHRQPHGKELLGPNSCDVKVERL